MAFGPAQPSLPDGARQPVEMVLRQVEGNRCSGPPLSPLDVLAVGAFPRPEANRSVGEPPGRFGEAFQVFGVQSVRLVELVEAVVGLAPCAPGVGGAGSFEASFE